MPVQRCLVRLGLALGLCGVGGWQTVAHADPFASAFTYQGVLDVAGVPADGTYDIQFTAFSDESNATPLAPPVVVENVLADDGVFVARVDFGPKFFVGDAVWLELAVRPGTQTGAFETLAPRQEVTPAPYALKPAADSITDIELADGAVGSLEIQTGAVDTAQLATAAVGSTQLQNNAIGTTQIANGSVLAEDLAAGIFDATYWRLGGNPGAGTFLGTNDGAALRLQSDSGVSVNAAPINGQSELTLYGTPAPDAANADLVLWPRDGTGLFSLTAQGTAPSDALLGIYAVGLSPFTGFLPRLLLDWNGNLGVGGSDPTPLARVHVTRTELGIDAVDLPNTLELVLEDSDAQMALYSSGGGGFGSLVALAEMDGAGVMSNQWAMVRNTTQAGAALNLAYGTDISAGGNPILFRFGNNASLGIGGTPPNATTEAIVFGSPAALDTAADLSLQPRGGTALFNWSAAGSDESDTSLALQFTGPGFNYEPRLRFAANGGVSIGRFASAAGADSFVFADDSSASLFGSAGPNQFLVRATDGVAINGAPLSSVTELTVRSESATVGASSTVALVPGANARNYQIAAGGGTASNTTFSINYNDPADADPFKVRFVLLPNGFTSINPNIPSGYILPAFPLTVGTDATNGNGAHVSQGGVWVNGSSRTFKQAFTAIDAEAILERLLDLPITRWQYRNETGAWHLGPMAEDFRAAFGLGEDERYIGTVDADGVAMVAVQGLNRKLETRAALLETENAALRESVDALARRVEALEANR